MSVATYTGSLNILGAAGNLSAWQPRLTVRPEVEASGPEGLIASKPRPVTVNSVTGAFSMSLFPSTQLTGADGRQGVRYVIELALFDTTLDESTTLIRQDLWTFTAIEGGGDVKDMGSAPPVAFITGPPWPATARPGTYFDVATGDLGFYGIGVI